MPFQPTETGTSRERPCATCVDPRLDAVNEDSFAGSRRSSQHHRGNALGRVMVEEVRERQSDLSLACKLQQTGRGGRRPSREASAQKISAVAGPIQEPAREPCISQSEKRALGGCSDAGAVVVQKVAELVVRS